MTPSCRLDHLVVAARTLDQGVAWIRSTLGVEIGPGGAHPRMATHNRLMKVATDAFLEVIAIDPTAVAPPSPRWYGLDDPEIQASLQHSPRLLTWVVRIQRIAHASEASAIPLGPVVPASRGTLHWQITVPADGSLPELGVMPTVIQWPKDAEPWTGMADTGCRLVSLTLHHPEPDRIVSALAAIAAWPMAELEIRSRRRPGLTARIACPHGEVVIG